MGRPHSTEFDKTPIVQSHLKYIEDNLCSLVTVVKRKSHSVELAVRTPFDLFMLLGCVCYLWSEKGISYDTLTIWFKELKAKISIQEHPTMNRLITEFL